MRRMPLHSKCLEDSLSILQKIETTVARQAQLSTKKSQSWYYGPLLAMLLTSLRRLRYEIVLSDSCLRSTNSAELQSVLICNRRIAFCFRLWARVQLHTLARPGCGCAVWAKQNSWRQGDHCVNETRMITLLLFSRERVFNSQDFFTAFSWWACSRFKCLFHHFFMLSVLVVQIILNEMVLNELLMGSLKRVLSHLLCVD